MKRSALKRKTPLRRNSPSKRQVPRKVSAYKARVRDVDYMLWVKRLPCAARTLGGCRGRVEADHAGRRALGQKAHDRTCIPLCRTHHVQRGSFSGPFREWTQVQMRLWLVECMVNTCNLYLAHHKGVDE